MTGVIHQGAHRKGGHVFSREGPEQHVEGVYVLKCGIEPRGVVLGIENHRHAGVDRLHEGIRLRGDDRAGFDGLAIFGGPVFPESRKGKRSPISQPDPHRLLLFPLELPLVKTIGNH